MAINPTTQSLASLGYIYASGYAWTATNTDPIQEVTTYFLRMLHG